MVVGVGLEPTFPSCSAVVLPVERSNHFFCTLIVSHFKGFVKRFFHSSVKGFEPYRLGSQTLPRLLTPLLYHNLGGLSRGFFIFFRLSFRALVSAASLAYPYPKVETLGSVVPPLDNDSIPQTAQKVKYFFQKNFN